MTLKKHKHHIIPKHAGGTDEAENLVELSVQDHIKAHYDLYAEFGRYQDFCAAKMLEASLKPNFREELSKLAHLAAKMKAEELGLSSVWFLKDEDTRNHVLENLKEVCHKGGKVQGKKNAESGHMRNISISMPNEDRKMYGKMGSEVCKDKKVNAFFDPELRQNIASKGGKVQGKKNAESGHIQKLATINRQKALDIKNGIIEKPLPFKWITNGVINKKIKETDTMPDGFSFGKVQKPKS